MVNKEKYCFGLHSIYEHAKNIKISKKGNYIKSSVPVTVTWVYAECEIIPCGELEGYIKHSEGMGDLHKDALIFYVLSTIYMHENNNNLYGYYARKYQDLFSKILYSKMNSIKDDDHV